jgi:hypothetical protein
LYLCAHEPKTNDGIHGGTDGVASEGARVLKNIKQRKKSNIDNNKEYGRRN